MAKLAANPFKFGDPVEGDYYLSRPDLSATVAQFLENHIHIVLMGPRRFGKTSFVLNLLSFLEKKGYTCLLVDIFNITSHRDFLYQFIRAMESKKPFSSKLRTWWNRLRLAVPKITADLDPHTGSPSTPFHQNLAIGLRQSTSNQRSQIALYRINTARFAIVDFR
ncbi:MAG: ATPase [Parachlamydiales bacterium]|nr:ATPase [Parachlamydiales bacterium]